MAVKMAGGAHEPTSMAGNSTVVRRGLKMQDYAPFNKGKSILFYRDAILRCTSRVPQYFTVENFIDMKMRDRSITCGSFK